MDVFKERSPSAEMLTLRSLHLRMGLPDSDFRHYSYLLKGYEGELEFDGMTRNLSSDCIILNDLLLTHGGNEFQIDTLMVYSSAIFLVDVKNYEGDHLYDEDKFYRIGSDYPLKNPLHQLRRCETMLHQLLQSLGWKLPITSYVLFINSEFTLYQTPLDRPFLYRSQLNRFLQKLNQTPSKLTPKHTLLAEKLASLHQTHSKNTKLPEYTYSQLRKGIFCEKCQSFSVGIEGRFAICNVCGHKEPVGVVILRCVKELRLLFPEIKITTSVVYEWCGGVISKRRINWILDKNFEMIRMRRWSYFKDFSTI